MRDESSLQAHDPSPMAFALPDVPEISISGEILNLCSLLGM